MASIDETSQNEVAPDGSIVRLLKRTARASVIRCTLDPGRISRAVQHISVEEIWYCLRGNGQLWRSGDEGAAVDPLTPGALFIVAPRTCFQFRNDGAEALELLITTLPPWPGAHEAQACDGCWTPNV